MLSSRRKPAPVLEGTSIHPALLSALRARGIDPAPLARELAEQHAERLATSLMALYRDGRSALAFDALYQLTRPAVLSWIQGLLRRSGRMLDPAEVLQDTFVNVYRYPTAFREEHAGSFRVWVRTIAGNLVRRASHGRQALPFHELPEGTSEPEDLGHCPSRQAQDGEESSTLRSAWVLFLAHYARAFAALAPRDREALRLVEVEGLTYADAGALLSVGRSNMKMIVFRARHRLARHMRASMANALAGKGGSSGAAFVGAA
jgi:RNA polymerase sigma factor (sigma-70 family)